jgi:hypothetical protein
MKIRLTEFQVNNGAALLFEFLCAAENGKCAFAF